MIIVKIDLKKIDQSKCFTGKNGAKYLDIVLMENRQGEDTYGNTHMAVQGVTKEDRERGIKGVILGNAKTIGQSRSPAPREKPADSGRYRETRSPSDSDDIPF